MGISEAPAYSGRVTSRLDEYTMDGRMIIRIKSEKRINYYALVASGCGLNTNSKVRFWKEGNIDYLSTPLADLDLEKGYGNIIALNSVTCQKCPINKTCSLYEPSIKLK